MKVAFGVSLSPGTPLLQETDTRRFIASPKGVTTTSRDAWTSRSE